MKQLPHSTVSIPPVILGTWALGEKNWGHSHSGDAKQAIETALDTGITAFDTAPAYGMGKAEELLGTVIGNNTNAVIMTKGGLDIKNFFSHNLSPSAVEKEITESLRRLKRDAIDIYICHWPDPDTPFFQTVEKLEECKKKGYMKSYGLSNYHGDTLKEAVSAGNISLVQMRYSFLYRNNEKDMGWCSQNSIPVSVYGTLEGGILTGKYGAAVPSFSKKDARNFFYRVQDHTPEETVEALKQLKDFAEEKNIPATIAPAAWCLENQTVDAVIAGARNEKQVRTLRSMIQAK